MKYYVYYNWEADTGTCLEYKVPVPIAGFVKIMESDAYIDFGKYRLTKDKQLELRDDGSKDYVKFRVSHYPPISDQMDMLWHAMNNGVLPKVEPFYSDIKAVKDAFPKPESVSN